MTAPIVTIDATGIHQPDFDEVKTWLEDQYRAIYGADIYIEPDSQDGQLIGIFALALHDCNSTAVAVYNSRGPATAQGEGLSSVVKINGLARLVPTRSTVDLRVIGQAGAVITNGAASDDDGRIWDLPASVTVPIGGEITVTATAREVGAVTAAPGRVTTIQTPTRGWQSVTNLAAAAVGSPVESDAALRRRQAISTQNPATSPLQAIEGAVAAITGVTRTASYENDTSITDDRGLPPHSVAVVAAGGDATAIAQTIALKKTVGTATHGTTTISVLDAAGVPRSIKFSRPVDVEINVALTLRPLTGWNIARGEAIKQEIVDWLRNLKIGESVFYTRLFLPANLNGDAARGSQTFEIVSMTTRRGSAAFSTADVAVAYNEAAWAQLSSISITVVP